MSRWLYTFAVVAPPIARDVRNMIEAGEEDIDLWVQNAVISRTHVVAYYKSLMDGWYGLNHMFVFKPSLIEVLNPQLQEVFQGASDDGKPRVVPTEMIAQWEDLPLSWRPSARTQPGWYAVRDFVHAVHDWIVFSKATECPGFFSARVLGGSCSDGSFKLL